VRILDRYVGWSVLMTTLFAVVMLSFFLMVGNTSRELMNLIVNRDLPWQTALTFSALVLPFTLTFTIPWAFLVALLLCFGRISADNELVVMQANGISLTRCCAPVFLLAIGLSGLCLWINVQVSPWSQQRMFSALREMAVANPMSLFPTGVVIDDFSGRRIYIGEKEADRMIGVSIFELDADGLLNRAIFAREAHLRSDPKQAGLVLHLKDARIEERSKNSADILGMRPGLAMSEGTYQIAPREFSEANRRGNAMSARSLSELRALMAASEDPEKQRAEFEYHKRFSLAGACLAFAFLAVPLGISAHRRESVVGFGLSLIVAFAYYLAMIVAQTLIHAGSSVFLIWLPNLVLLLLGGTLFFRQARR
jgi:lipopolysaccharide export system permease protein